MNYDLFPITQEVFRKRFKIITEIYSNNEIISDDNLKELVDEYYRTDSSKRKLDIRYGAGRGDEYSNTLREKAKLKIGTVDKIEYWLNKGYDVETANIKRREFYHNLNKIATEHNKTLYKNNPDEYKKRYQKLKGKKNSYQYWINMGYSIEEARNILKESHASSRQSLDNFIKRYGDVDGPIKFDKMGEKRLATRLKNHGSIFTGNRVSKASIKYFIKIYKSLRKMGIEKFDIVWGIGKQKEFIKYDKNSKRNYAYDFVIKSKKVVIEYNDPFWHARNETEWRNPFTEYADSLNFDKIKTDLLIRDGYRLLVVWSDKLPNVEDVIEFIYG